MKVWTLESVNSWNCEKLNVSTFEIAAIEIAVVETAKDKMTINSRDYCWGINKKDPNWYFLHVFFHFLVNTN